MKTIITKKGFDKLNNELNELIRVERPQAYQLLEETRPIGVSDEFPPEYLQAIECQDRIERKINDLQLILSDCVLWDKSMISYNSYGDYKVGFGATVTFVNTETNVNKTYTIVVIDYLAFHRNKNRDYDYFAGFRYVDKLTKEGSPFYTYRDVVADYFREYKAIDTSKFTSSSDTRFTLTPSKKDGNVNESPAYKK